MAKIKVDFTNTTDGFNAVDKAGTYPVKVLSYEMKKSSAGKPYIKWEMEVTTGEFKGSKLWNNTSLQPQALFGLRDFLIACGLEVPKKTIKLDLDAVIGKKVAAIVKMKEYNGEDRPDVSGFKQLKTAKASDDDLDIEDVEDADDEDEEEIDLDDLELE